MPWPKKSTDDRKAERQANAWYRKNRGGRPSEASDTDDSAWKRWT